MLHLFQLKITAQECSTWCANTTSCTGFAFNFNEHRCWLKTVLQFPANPNAADILTYYKLYYLIGGFNIKECLNNGMKSQ